MGASDDARGGPGAVTGETESGTETECSSMTETGTMTEGQWGGSVRGDGGNGTVSGQLAGDYGSDTGGSTVDLGLVGLDGVDGLPGVVLSAVGGLDVELSGLVLPFAGGVDGGAGVVGCGDVGVDGGTWGFYVF